MYDNVNNGTHSQGKNFGNANAQAPVQGAQFTYYQQPYPQHHAPIGQQVVTISLKKFNHRIKYWSILSWINFLDAYNAHAHFKHEGETVCPGDCYEERTFNTFCERLKNNTTLVRDGIFRWDHNHNEAIPTQAILKTLKVPHEFLAYANLSLFNHLSEEVEAHLNCRGTSFSELENCI